MTTMTIDNTQLVLSNVIVMKIILLNIKTNKQTKIIYDESDSNKAFKQTIWNMANTNSNKM